MIGAILFLLLLAAIVARMVYDVQKIREVKIEKTRLQMLAGLEVDEPELMEVATQRAKERLQPQQETKTESSNENNS